MTRNSLYYVLFTVLMNKNFFLLIIFENIFIVTD